MEKTKKAFAVYISVALSHTNQLRKQEYSG